MGIYKPLNYDATMLIRLTTEMKDAFFAGCKARGVVQVKKLGANRCSSAGAMGS